MGFVRETVKPRVFACVFAISLIVSASPLTAQSVTIDVEGTLQSACALTDLPGNFSLGNLVTEAGQEKTINFKVDCNAPFAYSIKSGNGALKRTLGSGDIVAGSLPFTTEVPYQITTNFTTDAAPFGDNGLVSTNLTAANEAPCVGAVYSASCPFANSGLGAAAVPKDASLKIKWDLPIGAPLIGGTFSDTLTLTVRVRS